MPIGQMPVRRAQNLDRTVDRYTRAGLPEIRGEVNVRATVRDNMKQNKNDTHPVPE